MQQTIGFGRDLPAVYEAPAECQCRGSGMMPVGSALQPLGFVVCSCFAGRGIAIRMGVGALRQRQATR